VSKKTFHRIFILTLISLITLPTYVSLVSSASGYIRVNGKSTSLPGQQVQAGGTVNLYFGEVVWSGTQFRMLMSYDNNPQISVSDLICTPLFSISNLTKMTTTIYSGDLGTWLVGNNWINGTVAQNIPSGNYTIKAFDEDSGTVALTDVFITVYSVIYSSNLSISPPSGPGGISAQFTGTGFPPSSSVTISYFDPSFGSWNPLTTATANATGGMTFSNQIPDLRKSLGVGDYPEAYMSISYRAEIHGVIYCFASYNQYERGLKRVGNQTANGLFGNGTDLSNTINVSPGDSLTLSGKWFHPGDAVYIRWDGQTVVGTVTGSQWLSAQIIGTTIANSTGGFDASVIIPTASAGAHFMSIEDSQTKVIIKVYASRASLALSPPSGPGGITVQFTGTGYTPSSPVTISYNDPKFGTWNVFGTTTSDESGNIQYSAAMPDLGRSLGAYDSIETSYPVSFRTEEQSGNIYCYTNYNEYARGLKTVANQTASGLYGNGTNLSSTVRVSPGNTLTISGKWFHPSDVVYIRWDGQSVVGTVTGDQWRTATIIGQSIANSTGFFQATTTIPDADPGTHYVSVEDSQAKVIIQVSIDGPGQFPPPNRPPSTIDLFCTCTTTYIVYKVDINGTLSGNQTFPIPSVSVLISYSSNGGTSWQDLTSVATGPDGKFYAEWMPSASGTYLIRARWNGNSAYNGASKTVTLAAVPYSNQNVFSVTSNSTVSQLSFNSTNNELSFVVSGESGTTGVVDVAIAKSLILNISHLTVYLDGATQQYAVNATSDSWFIHFSYSHSTHYVTMDLGATVAPSSSPTSSSPGNSQSPAPTGSNSPSPEATSTPEIPVFQAIVIILAVMIAVLAVLIVAKKKRART
jgi:hypothetical protein